MEKPTYETALIVGAGSGLSASLARVFAGEGMRVALAARNPEKLATLCAATGAKAFACDAVDPAQVAVDGLQAIAMIHHNTVAVDTEGSSPDDTAVI